MSLKSTTQGISLFFIFVFVLAFIIYGSQFLLTQNKSYVLSSIASGAENAKGAILDKNDFPQRDWQVQDLAINATSGISVESNETNPYKVLFTKNSDIKLPIASLTKLMTAVIVLDNYNLADNITLDKKADLMPPVQQDLKVGNTLPIEEFLYIMLIESSNKSAFALSEKIGEPKFVDLMNKKALDIGLANTFFADPTGLSDRNVSTAKDLSKLAEYILKNYPKIIDISRTQAIDLPNYGVVTNTNQLLGQIPEIIAGKTGFTTDAKGCLLLVVSNQKANDYLIYVILGSDDRFSEMKNIINWTNSAYKWQ